MDTCLVEDGRLVCFFLHHNSSYVDLNDYIKTKNPNQIIIFQEEEIVRIFQVILRLCVWTLNKIFTSGREKMCVQIFILGYEKMLVSMIKV